MLAIEYWRRKRGLAQADLAALARTDQSAVSQIERGRRNPTDALLGRLADALGVSPAFLLLRPVVLPDEVTFADEASA